MIRSSSLLIVILMSLVWSGFSQPAEKDITREEYINLYKDDAVKEMLKSGVPASITLAQGILESGNGNSALARYAKNHFGIKCHNGWNGETFIQDDDAKNECFRKYSDVFYSFQDHSEFLVSRDRYKFLFDLPRTDYENWAKGLKLAGYATNPKYADLLIRIIEENELDKYDKTSSAEPIVQVSHQKPVTQIVKNTYNIFLHDNKIKYTVASAGDTPFKIAKSMDLRLWQIAKYNDLEQDHRFKEGEIVYLQPKRNSSSYNWHTVSQDETMHQISQKYGVKLKKLYKKNKMVVGTEPKTGQRLELK